ncbi:MAG TPA: hypothetical protein VMD49_10990 [Steroidobacteraceae bacterium]|nr:hypothetical protein [Steroidobacteraceae bacterium]HUN74700.1 hypothetical protein [Steroidobacteraceae bacterium]
MSDPSGTGQATAPPLIARFSGRVECRRPSGAGCLALVGRTVEGAQMHLSLRGGVPEDLPAQLEAPRVEQVGAERYEISCAERTWTLDGRCFVHVDVGTVFYAAVPPRPVPLPKRALWRWVLAAARTRIVQRWLARRGA